MIIQRAQKVRTLSESSYAWSGLRKFQNIDLVTKRLIELHDIPKRFHRDVRKQAQQIRYCLTQAREYFVAAGAVTLATRPNLLYYGTMSLALAEILYKQSGNSSLDRAREDHRHHGLSIGVGSIKQGCDLERAASLIRARPHGVGGIRRGTFELWHRSCREHPLAGKLTRFLPDGGTNVAYELLFGAIDAPYPSLPEVGITFADCLSCTPLLMEFVEQHGLQSRLTRGKSEGEVWPGPEWKANHDVIFHPSDLFPAFKEKIRINANSVDRVHVREAGYGAAIRLMADWVNGFPELPLSPAATINADEWRMWTNDPALNEFGFLYVGLYLAGNYARYFPDLWLFDVETSAPLALAVEEFCNVCEWRAPWLTLCELDQVLYAVET